MLIGYKVKKDAEQSIFLDWWEKNKRKWLVPFPETKADKAPAQMP